MQWRRRLVLPLVLPLLILDAPTGSAAEPGIRASTETSTFPANLENQHRVKGFEVATTFSNPDGVLFTATFNGNISANTFLPAGNAVPVMRVKVFFFQPGSGADASNITIESPKVPYENETKIDAISSNPCGAKTWMNKGSGLVYFEISRNCHNLPDKFFSALYVDSDANRSTSVDFMYLPGSSALGADFTKIPKPAKAVPKGDQLIAGYPGQSSYTLDVATAFFSTSTNSGLPIQIVGKTPAVCTVTSSTTISLNGVGNCIVSLFAPGNDLWNPSSENSFSFNVLPKKVIPKVDQKLYFNPPGTLYENDGEYDLDVYAESELEIQISSSTPRVCIFPYAPPNNTVVRIVGAGTCSFSVKQAGNERWNPREGSTGFEIYAVVKAPPTKSGSTPTPAPAKRKPAPKIEITAGQASTSGGGSSGTSASGTKLTDTKVISIICFKITDKGIVEKPVKGVKPVCPKGFKPRK